MPSDMNPKPGLGAGSAAPGVGDSVGETGHGQLPSQPEPPSVKLIVRLFLIPLLIAAAVVAVMLPFGLLAGGRKPLEEAFRDLQNPGGERTGGLLVGPAAKQRYMDAKIIVDYLRENKITAAERIKLSNQVIDVLNQWSSYKEGDVQQALLFALSIAWIQRPDPAKPGEWLSDADDTANLDATDLAQKKAMDCILRFADQDIVRARTAAILSTSFWKGRKEAERAIPVLISKLQNQGEDLDVKLSAATALGPIADRNDKRVIDVLNEAMRISDPREAEVVWGAAVSLAQLNRPEATDIVLRLMDRKDLNEFMVYDRTDASNPMMRKLREEEKERFIINTLLAAQHLKVDSVQKAMERVSKEDPSERVKQGALEILKAMKSPGK